MARDVVMLIGIGSGHEGRITNAVGGSASEEAGRASARFMAKIIKDRRGQEKASIRKEVGGESVVSCPSWIYDW